MTNDLVDEDVDVVESLEELEELLGSRYDDEFDLEGTLTVRVRNPEGEVKEERVVDLG